MGVFARFALLGFSIYLAGVNAIPASLESSTLSKRCVNSATDRTCWGDYDISTDYYSKVPDTGVTVEYYFELVNTTASPDGYERQVLLVNGSLPGPTIEANWGDTIVVYVTNSLTNNGTGIHFHGIRQNYTNQMDGVPSITQCPVAPGESTTYTWRATQYGTTWYHSHFALQAWEGIFGGIVIHGPATSNYDEDVGVVFLNDWSHQTSDALYYQAETSGPPPLDNGLINGTNVYGDEGSRFEMVFVSGTKYLIRLINGAIDTHFKFSIDGHNLTVIASDLVPIVPYTTEVLSIGIGQRYDIIVEANQDTADYWLRAIPQTTCSDNDSTDNIKGIIRYNSSSTSDPTTSAYTQTDDCDDEAVSNIVPYVSKTVGDKNTGGDLPVTLSQVNKLFKWYINGTTMAVEWSDPTLLQVYNGESSWANQSGVIELATADEWAYFVIETTLNIPHPIHLHGHDFFILAQGTGTYAGSSPTLNTANPPRRDVAMLPGSGYLVLAFQADNPGAWLMHCHIGWHTSEGFALQFIERYDEIEALIDFDSLNSTCTTWDTYQTEAGIEEDDSGV